MSEFCTVADIDEISCTRSWNSHKNRRTARVMLFTLMIVTSLLKPAGICAKNILPQVHYLHQGWTFRKAGTTKWYKASVPGTVHTDLMANGKIPDPFYRDNEQKVQWVSQCDWEYQTYFQVDEKMIECDTLYLNFDGLDTYADVWLNNERILQADNMFQPYTCLLVHGLKKGKNHLRILFHSVLRKADSLANLSFLKRPCENNRHYVRKAQYHFGWDWAPRIPGCGIWKAVSISTQAPSYGASVYSPVQLVTKDDSIGQSFYFEVAGKPTYMKGANWIPADVFLPRINRERYRQLLIKAKEAHFNMLRVWGGGIYESDDFYQLCDSLGIYVWQDFMFAGAMYPADSISLLRYKQEIISQVKRLRQYKCIVLWCGNNEIDEAWHNWGWQKQFQLSAADSTQMWQEYQQIFETLIPGILQELDPGRSYIPSSPRWGWGRAKSMEEGDAHYWGLWWGMDSLQVMQRKIPRFMSEFGMQAMPVMSSIRRYSLPSDWDTNSVVMRVHQKHPTGYANLNRYLKMEQIQHTSFTEFVLATQELQARAMRVSLQAQLQSKGRCMGSLIWQFNDCWPVCSWSLVDYYGQPKRAYEEVKRWYQ